MQLSDFFREQDQSARGFGAPWPPPSLFKSELMDKLRKSPQDAISDLDAARVIADLAYRELKECATSAKQQLSEDEIALTLRGLKAVLRRLGIDVFNPPFRDFSTFHGYWSGQGMTGGGSWALRSGYLSELFAPLWLKLDDLEGAESTSGAIRGVRGEVQNIIFASVGHKPEFVVRDALSNVIEVVANADSCLIYDRPLTSAGLTWGDLVAWWRARQRLDGNDRDVGHDLYLRMRQSIGNNPAELLVLNAYSDRYLREGGLQQPALVPQVYLHYDPLTKKQRITLGKGDRLKRERMDFLLLVPGGERIVIEVDGQQHYAESTDPGAAAAPRLYSEMVAEDHALRLRGYEVYRFGGFELTQDSEAPSKLRKFFDELESR